MTPAHSVHRSSIERSSASLVGSDEALTDSSSDSAVSTWMGSGSRESLNGGLPSRYAIYRNFPDLSAKERLFLHEAVLVKSAAAQRSSF